MFKKGFRVDYKKHEWEEKANESELKVERWVLAYKAVMDPAKIVWRINITSDTTHVVAEKLDVQL